MVLELMYWQWRQLLEEGMLLLKAWEYFYLNSFFISFLTISELGEILRLQDSIQRGLVSYTLRFIQRIIRMSLVGESKNGYLFASPFFLGIYVNNAECGHSGNYVGDKIPKAFPLATACVRFLTPSLP